MEGVIAAVVGFIFVCVIFPTLVKNRPQFYGALFLVLGVVVIQGLGQAVQNVSFYRFVAFVDALLTAGAVGLMILATGGLTARDLANDLGKTVEVIRRGGEKETIIVPLSGEKPKPRRRDEDDLE